jgi:hypothetical protein
MSRARAAIAATLSIAFPDRLCVGVPGCPAAVLDDEGADRPKLLIGDTAASVGAVCATTVEAGTPASIIANAIGPTVLEKQLLIVIGVGSRVRQS